MHAFCIGAGKDNIPSFNQTMTCVQIFFLTASCLLTPLYKNGVGSSTGEVRPSHQIMNQRTSEAALAATENYGRYR